MLLCILLKMGQNKTNSFLFSPINYFELQITKLQTKTHRYFLNQKYNDISTGNSALNIHNLGQT